LKKVHTSALQITKQFSSIMAISSVAGLFHIMPQIYVFVALLTSTIDFNVE